jgi:hypothetical protein
MGSDCQGEKEQENISTRTLGSRYVCERVCGRHWKYQDTSIDGLQRRVEPFPLSFSIPSVMVVSRRFGSTWNAPCRRPFCALRRYVKSCTENLPVQSRQLFMIQCKAVNTAVETRRREDLLRQSPPPPFPRVRSSSSGCISRGSSRTAATA